MKTVYKIVLKDFDANNLFEPFYTSYFIERSNGGLIYRIGEKTKSKNGTKLFGFDSFYSARKFVDDYSLERSKLKILRGECETIIPIKTSLQYVINDYKQLKEYLAYIESGNTFIYGKLCCAREGSLVCDSFTPLEVMRG